MTNPPQDGTWTSWRTSCVSQRQRRWLEKIAGRKIPVQEIHAGSLKSLTRAHLAETVLEGRDLMVRLTPKGYYKLGGCDAS